MNSKQLPLLLASALLVSTCAHAGRDESLIQLTRKNQLAYDARMKKEKQEKQRQEKDKQENGTGPASTAAPDFPDTANNGAGTEPSIPAKP
jgi:hypothetical protein